MRDDRTGIVEDTNREGRGRELIPGWHDLSRWLNTKGSHCRTVNGIWWMFIKTGLIAALAFSGIDVLIKSLPVKEIFVAHINEQANSRDGKIDIDYSAKTIPHCPVIVKQRITGCGEYEIGTIKVDTFPPDVPMSITVPKGLFDGSGDHAVCQYSAIIEYDCGDNKRGTIAQTIPFVVEK